MEALGTGFVSLLLVILLVLRIPMFSLGTVSYYFLHPLVLLLLGFLSIKFSSPRIVQRRIFSSLKIVAVSIALIQISLALMLGLLEGFGRSPYDHSFLGVLLNFWLVSTELFGAEFARAWILGHSSRKTSWGRVLFSTLAWTVLFSPWVSKTIYEDKASAVIFLGETLVPALAQNFFCSYTTSIAGAFPSITYRALISAFERLSPILPDLSWATSALTRTAMPLLGFVLALEARTIYSRVKGRRKLEASSVKSTLVLGFLAVILIWFTLGLFPYYPVVVATGSMEPQISPGDIVILRKNPKKIEVGDIIEFRRENAWVAHRVSSIYDVGAGGLFYTKGDANAYQDPDPVPRQAVRGKVVFQIPKAGILTLKVRTMRQKTETGVGGGT